MPLSGVFDKKKPSLAKRVLNFYEDVRYNYLSAREDPKSYSKNWRKSVKKKRDDFDGLYDFSTESVTPSATTIQTAMNTLWLSTVRGADHPDVIVAASNYFQFYWSSLQTNQRFTSDDNASAGFMNLMFMDAPVYYDDQCPTSKMYMLNSDYLFLRPAQGREFSPLGEKASVNQDAMVLPVVWAGNMTCSNRARQGIIQA